MDSNITKKTHDMDYVDYVEHDMDYGKYQDLKRRPQSDKFFKDKTFEIANNFKCDGYQRGLASMVCKCFDKKSKGSGIKNEIKESQ